VSSRGIGRVVVGYRAHDRRRLRLQDDYGIQAVPVRRCMAGCGYLVYFYSGGIDAVKERDAEVVCAECKDQYYPEIMAQK
jgi:hypothetical protein